MSEVNYDINDMLLKMSKLGNDFEQAFYRYFSSLRDIKYGYNDKLAKIVKVNEFKDIGNLNGGLLGN
ncbi:hypothetical protein HW560_11740 [Paenibacillus sp. E222]|uniref:hypothetical protein n=1 Tax=Paenibacillus sp. E222 TaxID=2748863 RepID=UPI0015C63730|nr:hypothetical protein [Paenibacillus sp. E222]QLG38711.1 hypothetical protein HW560_11740 [Paenibacillus sp. E222]